MEYQRVPESAQTEQSKTPSSSLRQTPFNHAAVHPLLELQRTLGNQAVLNMLRSSKQQSQSTQLIQRQSDENYTPASPYGYGYTPASSSRSVEKQSAQVSTGQHFPTDAQAWQGLQFLPVVEGELPKQDIFALSHSSIIHGIYRIYPQLRNHNEPHVVYYIAYNTRAERAEYAIGPDNLDTFLNHNFLYMVAAGNFFGLSGHVKPYEVSSAQVGALAIQGNLRGAIRALGRSWAQAVRDPGWWIQATSATLGPLAAEGKLATSAVGESAESGLVGREVGATISGEGQNLSPKLPPSPQNVLIVGAETEGEFSYASEVASRGHNVTAINPQVTAEAEAYASRGGNFVRGRIEDLPAEPTFDVIREDFPFPMGRAFQPTAEFANERLARLAPGGRWTVVTESSEFATTLEAAAQREGVTLTVKEVPLFHEGAPQSIWPKETNRFVLIFEKRK